MTLSLHEEFPLAHPGERVWEKLADVAFVAECFPGATLEEELPNGEHRGSLAMKLGPTKARFAGTVAIEFDDDARTAVLSATGGDSRRTRATAQATVQLQDAGPSRSVLVVEAAIQVSGPLGQFAKAGGVEVTRTLLGDFAANVDSRIPVVVAAAPAASTTIPPPASSTTLPTAASPRPADSVSVVKVLARSIARAVKRLGQRIRSRRSSK